MKCYIETHKTGGTQEVITVEQWTQIREMYYTQHMSQRRIARTLGVHRSAVKRAIETRGGPRYQRSTAYKSILDPFKVEICQLLESADGDIPITVIYEHLAQREDTPQSPRYHGSYENLWRYAHEVKSQLHPKEAYLQIETPAGLDSQCDWGKVDLVISGEPKRVSIFVLTLCYSRLSYAKLYFLERQECFFDGHCDAFEYFKGVPKQVTYDNLSTAVYKVLSGRNRIEQESFIRFRGEFPFAANFAAVGKGNEKGKVENAIQYIRNHAFGLSREFPTLKAANTHLYNWLVGNAKRIHRTHKQVIAERHHSEMPHLSPLPKPMPLAGRLVAAKVNKFSFVTFETNRYSVPVASAHQSVFVKALADKIVIVRNDQVIATHDRLFSRHGQQVKVHHFLSLLQQKPRAIEHASVIEHFDLDPVFIELKQRLTNLDDQPNQKWIAILRLTEHYPLAQVVTAVKTALAWGVMDFESIKNLLDQQLKPKVRIDNGNCLVNHPHLADVEVSRTPLTSYDTLLEGR